jgi:serine/threonine protein kinase
MCIAEREALEAIDSPFVVSLKYAFHSSSSVFLVLDLMMGGDLCFHLRNSGCFNIEQTRYYAARTLLGLSILHLHGFVYRDLKPENILLDSDGYSKITDMGLAKYVENKARGVTGICGTRGYWAPEMLMSDSEGHSSRYSFEVDWFSLGCCIYEFLLGVSPFRTEAAKNFGEGFDHTTRAGKDRAMDLAVMEMDPDLSSISDENCRSLLSGLLHKVPSRRLGAKGFQEIAHHPFFEEISWDTLHHVVPPYKPRKKENVVRGSELSSFEDEKEMSKIRLDVEDQKFYSDWNYVSKKGAQEELVEYFVTAAQAAGQGSPSNIHYPFSMYTFKPASIHPYQQSKQPSTGAPNESTGVNVVGGKENIPNAATATTSLIEINHQKEQKHRSVASSLSSAFLPKQFEYYDADGNVHGGSQCCVIS